MDFAELKTQNTCSFTEAEQFCLNVHSFTDVVKSGIFEDFSVDFSEITI